MKKFLRILMIITLLLPYLIIPTNVEGKTLGDLKKELATMEEELQKNKEEKQLTEKQIRESNQKISNIRAEIDQINNDVIKLNNEIIQLKKDIATKEEEIKEILKFIQISNGESVYLEYAFGAKTFTDFIYRAAVAEQLSKYNDELIKKYNQMIVDNNNKTIELNNKEVELKKKQDEISAQVVILGQKAKELAQEGISKEEEIKNYKETIKNLQEKFGCKDYEDIKTCGRNQLPPTTTLYRPVVTATITSRYGNRSYWLDGKQVSDFHYGIDMSESGYSVPIYAAGSGMVGKTLKTNCGGNWVIIWHEVNGKSYSTVYMHLRNVYVKDLERVTKDTVIGTMGGNPNIETYDGCSTGQHLHFAVARGHYYRDYSDYYGSYLANNINPEVMVNFPARGSSSSFYDRYTQFSNSLYLNY